MTPVFKRNFGKGSRIFKSFVVCGYTGAAPQYFKIPEKF